MYRNIGEQAPSRAQGLTSVGRFGVASRNYRGPPSLLLPPLPESGPSTLRKGTVTHFGKNMGVSALGVLPGTLLGLTGKTDEVYCRARIINLSSRIDL